MESTERPAPMKTFVVIFRQGPRTLSDSDLKRRAEDTSAWARTHNAAGHKLDPRILGPERVETGEAPSGIATTGAALITALLFLEARDLNEAAAIARAHPGLQYGAIVEVRPWGAPVPLRSTR